MVPEFEVYSDVAYAGVQERRVGFMQQATEAETPDISEQVARAVDQVILEGS